jgi:NitT/TauT family transport system substrate-binding protein
MSTINIQFTLFSAFYSPLISTMTAGFFKEEGLDYNWSIAKPGVSARTARRTSCSPHSAKDSDH